MLIYLRDDSNVEDQLIQKTIVSCLKSSALRSAIKLNSRSNNTAQHKTVPGTWSNWVVVKNNKADEYDYKLGQITTVKLCNPCQDCVDNADIVEQFDTLLNDVKMSWNVHHYGVMLAC